MPCWGSFAPQARNVSGCYTRTSRSVSAAVMRDSDVFVVIPCYNEGEVLGQTVAGLEPYGFTIVVVDDGSSVATRQYLKGRPVKYLRHPSNLGQGAALQTGDDYALLQGAQCIVHFDADGQHDPALISRLIEPICQGKCDVVLGSRFLDINDRRQVPLTKRALLKAGVLVSWLFTGVWLSDTHNGLRALSRAAAQQINLTENGFAHATEILEAIRKAKLRYKEVPVTIRYTEYSQSKGQSVFNSINIVVDLILRKLSK
jgi:polyprenyl-phospho-N-acetylgalactosaminyl synthase